MAFCTNCGAELSPGAKFCVSCGKPLAAPQSDPVVTPADPIPQEPVFTPEAAPVNNNFYAEVPQSEPAPQPEAPAWNPPAQETPAWNPPAQETSSWNQPAQDASSWNQPAQNASSWNQPQGNPNPYQGGQNWNAPQGNSPYGAYPPPQGGFTPQPPKKKTNVGLIIGIAAAALLIIGLIVGLVIFFVNKGNDGAVDNGPAGVYVIDTVSIGGFSMDGAMIFGNSFAVKLREDGTCSMHADGDEDKGTWTETEKGKISITCGSSNLVGTYDESYKLTLTEEGATEDMTMTLKRTPYDSYAELLAGDSAKPEATELPAPTSTPEPEVAVNPVVGVYTLGNVSMDGVTVDGSAIFGNTFAMEILENGDCTVYADGEEDKGTWEEGADGEFILHTEAVTLYGTMEDGILTVTDDGETGLTMELKKTEYATYPEFREANPILPAETQDPDPTEAPATPDLETIPLPSQWHGTIDIYGYESIDGMNNFADGTYEIWGTLDYAPDGRPFFEIYNEPYTGESDQIILSVWIEPDEDMPFFAADIGTNDGWFYDKWLTEEDEPYFSGYLMDGELFFFYEYITEADTFMANITLEMESSEY